MTIDTKVGVPIDPEILRNYFKRLVNHLFKILPMREKNEESLIIYMQSLQVELLGCKSFVSIMGTDADYLSLLAILQYLIDHSDCSVMRVKREVFRAISICNKLQAKFLSEEVSQ